MSSGGGQSRRVFGLAAAHLRHEWILTLCLVSALAAVLAPLLILLGLKEGTIETLRDRLVQDPVYREIRPALTRTFDQQWLERLRQHPGVAFLTPTILPASSMLHLSGGAGENELIDLIPSAPGDPLLLENGGRIPLEGECVLSSEAARRLGVTTGAMVTARVTRSRAGHLETVQQSLVVVAVLSPRAGTLARVYTTLDFVEDVESYKEGRAVSSRGWGGDSARPYLSFDGVLVISRTPLDPIARTGLVVNTGLLKAEPMTQAAFTALTGLTLAEAWHAYDLSLPSGSVTFASISALQRKLRGRESLLLPYARRMRLRLPDAERALMGYSVSAAWAAKLSWPAAPWGELSANALNADRLLQILLPGDTADSGVALTVRFDGIEPLRFPLRAAGASGSQVALIPAELLGMLRTARDRVVSYRAESGGLLLERAGYRGFRLYARSIDDVPVLVEQLRRDGLEVVAAVEAISRIQVLDRGLTRLFWLIALLAVIGAGAVLIASLVAAVERERKDLGILRLLGLARTDVFLFPVFQGVMIALFGVALAWLGYLSLAEVINRLFGSELAPGQAICRLPESDSWVVLAATLLLALLSSLIAAWKATLIDPAEAIREE
ncbi:MAG: FtsX-like permease family protein [Chromatiaceae bacterium]|nr:FtsX-like permease family protein [Chromatiaceae bacterium]